MDSVRRVAVIGGNRIPFARSDGPYATASNQEMLGAALAGLVERYGLEGARIGEFAAGAVLKHSRDFNLARETVLGSDLDPATPAYDVQQACGTGLQAVIGIANKIALGQIDCGIAGGTDTASDAPLGVNDTLRRLLLEAAEEHTRDCHPRGCMIAMAATNCTEASAHIQAALAKRREAGMTGIRCRIECGISRQELPPETDAAALANFYATVYRGMALQAADGATRETLIGVAQAAMRAWPGQVPSA